MAKSNFQNIVNGLLGTFVSRNNDIDGYWGLGILRSTVEARGGQQVEINLLSADSQNGPIELSKKKYRSWLEKSLTKQGLAISSLSVAQIKVRFATSFEEFPEVIKDTRGLPYECTVEIGRGAEKLYAARKVGVCATHDPSKDRKSTRVSD